MVKKNILPLAVILAVVGVFWFANKSKPSPNTEQAKPSGKNYSVVLTQDGFTPQEISIQVGDTVTFTTKLNQPFWPASDLHPTHDLYPEFDPKQPIENSDSWSFTFGKEGSWKYHDHLYSKYRGIVKVSSATGSVPLADCDLNNNGQCWETQLDAVLNQKGLEEAFELMASLYQSQPVFAQACHAYSHKLGEAAYQIFSEGREVELSSKASYCGYGFYHGFMEKLLQTTGNIAQAKEFCAYAGEKLKSQTTDAEGACYHGIGHGTVDGSDPTAWGDAEKMMAPGMKMCHSVAGHDTSKFGKLYRCVSGAFNAVEILSSDKKYKLEAIIQNPFYLCPSQQKSFYEACYTNMLPALMRLTKNDFKKSAQIIEKIAGDPDYSVRSQVMLSLFHEWIRANLNETSFKLEQAVSMCRSLSPPMRLPCIEGLSGGHMKYGQPKREYVKAMAFCASSLLKEDEAAACYGFILPRLRIWYSLEKTQEICGSVPEKFRNLCPS